MLLWYSKYNWTIELYFELLNILLKNKVLQIKDLHKNKIYTTK